MEGVATGESLVWLVFLWAGWTIVLAALMVQLPKALTVVRIGVPLAVVLDSGLRAVYAEPRMPNWLGAVGIAVSIAVAILVMSADVGADFINGASYGDEQRIGLRPPGFVLIGPLPLLWLVTVAPALLAVGLLAGGAWAVGVPVLVVSIAATFYGFKVLNRLSERCLVLVPAGLTLVDPLALTEPTLFRRDDIVRLGPAVVGAEALDLTVGSPGLVISIDFSHPLTLLPAPRRGQAAETTEAAGVLIAVSRPGRLLDLAGLRRITVGRS